MRCRFFHLAATTVVIGLSGCGGGSGGGGQVTAKTDEQQIRQVYKTFSDALVAGDGATACRLLTERGRAGSLLAATLAGKTPSSCADAIAQIAKVADHKDLAASSLTQLSVSGAHATAFADGESVSFARVGGKWLNDSDAPQADTTTTAAADTPDNCDKLGINRAGGREGSCVSHGVSIYVASPGNPGAVPGLKVTLLTTRVRGAIKQEFSNTLRPEGAFLEVELAVTNTSKSSASFGFSGSLADSQYDPSTEAAVALGSRLHEPLGPGLTRRGSVVFDVARSLLPEVKKSGNVVVSIEGDESKAVVLRTYVPSS